MLRLQPGRFYHHQFLQTHHSVVGNISHLIEISRLPSDMIGAVFLKIVIRFEILVILKMTYTIPYATNIASAEVLITAVDAGALDYRQWSSDYSNPVD